MFFRSVFFIFNLCFCSFKGVEENRHIYFTLINEAECKDEYREVVFTKKNIYSPQFYLFNDVRINTNFMVGSTQKVLYLNYPVTFADETQDPEYKKTNGAGFIILSNQPKGVTATNLSAQKTIIPYAYFTTQENPVGWWLYSPADYYQRNEKATAICLYNDNILIGKNTGSFSTNVSVPHEVSTISSIKKRIDSYGKYNISLGNDTSQYQSTINTNFNTVVGSFSGNHITGSFNTFCGSRSGLSYGTYIIKSEDLIKDYYASNNFFNYNNTIGYGNLGFHARHVLGGFTAIKQNNIIGTMNFMSPLKAYRNCILGNLILSSYNSNEFNQFDWIDSNIMIGNELIYRYDNSMIKGLYGNIILIPNGGLEIYGGLGVSEAISPYEFESNAVQCNCTIMIGSCGSSTPYDRSYKTFIANIYQSSLLDSGLPVSVVNNQTDPYISSFIGETNFPVVTLVNSVDQLGQVQVVPYGDIDLNVELNNESNDQSNYKDEPGNVFDIDDIVTTFLFNADSMPVMGIALENTEKARNSGLLYTIDSYALVLNSLSESNNPLAIFLTYAAQKEKIPYQSITSPSKNNSINNAIVGETTIAGYEHYYLIPLLVRGEQILYELIDNLAKKLESEKGIFKNSFRDYNTFNKKIEKIEEIQKYLIYYLLSNDEEKKDIVNILKSFL